MKGSKALLKSAEGFFSLFSQVAEIQILSLRGGAHAHFGHSP